jgi:hypothetical protein
MADLIFKDLKTDQKNEITIGSIEVEVTYPDGKPLSGAAYELKLSTGESRKGTLDSAGRLAEGNIPKGATGELSVAGAPLLAMAE